MPATRIRYPYTVTYVIDVYNGMRWNNTKIKTITEVFDYLEGDVVVPQDISYFKDQFGFDEYLFGGWKMNMTDAPQWIEIGGNVLFEGRVDRIGANLVRGTRWMDSTRSPEPDTKDIRFSGGTYRTLENYAEAYAGNLQYVGYSTYPIDLPSYPADLVFSCMFRTTAGNGLGQSDYNFQVAFNGTIPSLVIKCFVDGVELKRNGNTPNQPWFFIPASENDREMEITLTYLQPGTTKFRMNIGTPSIPPGYQSNSGRFYHWLPKLEDVTNLSADQQRATIYTEHPDDPKVIRTEKFMLDVKAGDNISNTKLEFNGHVVLPTASYYRRIYIDASKQSVFAIGGSYTIFFEPPRSDSQERSRIEIRLPINSGPGTTNATIDFYDKTGTKLSIYSYNTPNFWYRDYITIPDGYIVDSVVISYKGEPELTPWELNDCFWSANNYWKPEFAKIVT